MDEYLHVDFEIGNPQVPENGAVEVEPHIDITGEPNSCSQGNVDLTIRNDNPTVDMIDLTLNNQLYVPPNDQTPLMLIQNESNGLTRPVGIGEERKLQVTKRQGQPIFCDATPSKVTKVESNNHPHPYFQSYSTGLSHVSVCKPSDTVPTKPLYPVSNHTITSADLAAQNHIINQHDQVHGEVIELTQQAGQIQPNDRLYQTSAFRDYSPMPISNEVICLGNSVALTQDTVFDQLLEMFPDIDQMFLREQCHQGMSVMETANFILEMNNYPKKTHGPKLTQMFPEPNLYLERPINDIAYVFDPPPLETTCMSCTVPDNGQVKFTVEKSDPRHKNAIQSYNTNIAQMFNGKEIKLLAGSNEPKSTQQSVIGEPVERSNIQNQYDFIRQILPDADPSFLEQKCQLGEQELRDFISNAIEKKDYPKLVMPTKKEESENDDLGLYTTNFNVEIFLKIIPEPFSYFMDDNRVCERSDHAQEFLKRRYRNHSIKNIAKKYKEYSYNLVKTCDFLDSELPTRASKRCLNEIHMPETKNLPFSQEACFIEHKNEIKTHLEGLAEAKRIAYHQAEERGELIECGCCYQQIIFEDCATCNEGDLFCKNCIKKSTEIRIGDGCTTFPCLIDCGSYFSLHMLQDLLNARVFSRLLQRIQLDEVKSAGIEGLEICPFCEFATIPPPETNIFTCLNPECLKESCRKCHKVSHIPQRCEEIENDDQARARKYIEDEMTKALVRECYKCKRSFIKSDGCNKMTCTCGAKTCYICRQPIKDYNHFNGPGGAAVNKCPLYSTDKVLHVDAVKAIAKKAKEVVTATNPELKLRHDPTKLLPSASAARNTLPAGVEERADVLLQNLGVYQEQLDQRYIRARVIANGLNELANRVDHLMNIAVGRQIVRLETYGQNAGGLPENPH